MPSELLPCPWCRAISDAQDEWGYLITHKESCYWLNSHGDSIGRVRVNYSDAERWNTRATTPAPADHPQLCPSCKGLWRHNEGCPDSATSSVSEDERLDSPESLASRIAAPIKSHGMDNLYNEVKHRALQSLTAYAAARSAEKE